MTLPGAVRCRVCGRLLAPAPPYPVCRSPDCRREDARRRYQESESRRLARFTRSEAIRDAVAPGPPDRPATALPVNERAPGPASPERHTAFLGYLRSVVAAAFSEPPPPAKAESPPPDGSPLLRAACALCRGWCCLLGADHNAYLDTTTIERVRRSLPSLGAEEILARYAAALPPVAYPESCVYHGPTGCALPEGFRAGICGDYLCDGLVRLTALTVKTGAAEGFAVCFKADLPVRAGVLGPEGPREVPLP